MPHTFQISERGAKYRDYKCDKYGTMFSLWSNPKWLWWQSKITLGVADNTCGLSISYRKKIEDVIR